MGNIIKHVYLVPDGNRTFAKKYGSSLDEAYKKASDVAWNSIRWVLVDNDAEAYTFYGLSLKNLEHRKLEQLEPIIDNETDFMERVIGDSFFYKNEIRFNPVGNSNFSRVCESRPELKGGLAKYNKALEQARAKTSKHKKKILNLLVGYSGILNTPKYSFEPEIPVDLRIRTANQRHMSDEPFLLLERAYWHCEPKLFPQLKKKDIDNAIRKAEIESEYFEFPETVIAIPQFIIGSIQESWARE